MLRRWAGAIALTLCLALPLTGYAARDTLVIGISQFPQNFNPNIESMLAKSYVLAMTRRPITVYNPDWKLICLLCTELPTYENGRAKDEKTADGKDGIAVTYSLLPQAVWGDGTPITVKDVLFTWNAGRHPKSGFGNSELFERITAIDVIDDKTFTLHVNKRTCDFAGISGLELLPAHIEEANFAASAVPMRRTRPIRGCGTVPIGSARFPAGRISCWHGIRNGGAKSRRSTASSSRRSRTRRR